jgi:hypothetical protein
MGFAEDVYRLASQVANRHAHCKGNEEATKHALILPFFQMLGYDIYDPSELVPEYKAGFASNKEKIDYAIFLKGQPVLFVEAKAVGEKLENYDAQLAKYFNSAPTLKLAVITNGLHYKFFTDLKEPNLLDTEPFFEFTLDSISEEEATILQGFRRDSFDPAGLVTQAENLVYLRALKRKCRALFREPSDEFVRFMASDVFPRKITANALERLTPLVKQAMSTVLVEMVSQGLSQEITKQDETTLVVITNSSTEETKQVPVTTEEEIAGFQAVYSVVAAGAGEDPRVGYKDTSAYLGIHVDKPSRWFVRLFFNGANKSVVARLPLVQANALLGEGKAEEYGDCIRVKVGSPEEIQAIAPIILAAYRAVTVSATV